MIILKFYFILVLSIWQVSGAEWLDRFDLYTTGMLQDAVLECDIDPGSNFTGFYRNGGQIILDTERIKVTSNGETKILDISQVTEDDYGLYFCNDTTSVDSTTLEISASLEPAPESPQILLAGEQGIVEYRVYGNPRPRKIEWTISREGESKRVLANVNSKGVVTDLSGGRYNIDGKGNILIANVKGEDSGVYQVTVRGNSGGRLKGSVIVKVEFKIEFKVKPPASFIRAVGQDLLIPCEFLYADSDVKWTFTNTKGETTRIREGINEKGLLLTKVSMESAGTYMCSASNKYGNLSAMSSLAQVIDPAKITSNFQGVVKRRLATFYEMVCSAAGKPLPNVVLSKLELVKGKSRFQQIDDSIGKVTKKFSKLAIADGGVYSCYADNGAKMLNGSTLAERRYMTLEIFASTEIEDGRTTKSVISAIGLDFVISCSAKGFPYPEVQLLGNGGNITTKVERVNDVVTAKIIVEKAEKSDFKYKNITCFAKNSYGSENVTIPLTQIVKAPCPQNLHSIGTIGLSVIDLQWDNVPGADKYFVYVNNSKREESETNAISVKRLKRKTYYSIVVKSVNLAGIGNLSCQPLIIETADIVRPNAIPTKGFDLEEVTSRSAVISWNAPSNIAPAEKDVLTYQVKWCLVTNNTVLESACSKAKEQKENRLKLKDLRDKKFYEIVVTAINQGKKGEQSEPFRFETDSPFKPTPNPSQFPPGLTSGEIAGIIVAIILIILIVIDVFCCFFNNCGFSHCCFETFCSSKDKKYLAAGTNDNSVNDMDGYETQELEEKKSTKGVV